MDRRDPLPAEAWHVERWPPEAGLVEPHPPTGPATPHRPASPPRPPVPTPATRDDGPEVSWIVPVHNAAAFLPEMLASLAAQSGVETVLRHGQELALVDDASTDASWALACEAAAALVRQGGWTVVMGQNRSGAPHGCGWACNAAIGLARGRYLCFADADDVSHPDRLRLQLATMRRAEAAAAAAAHGDGDDDDDRTLVGANFVRTPPGSTERYTAWLNRLTDDDLVAHRFVEVTLIKPTWFLRRSRWAALGGFHEGGRGVPEDMLFFYRHLEDGGRLVKARADDGGSAPPLLTYRFHATATSHAVLEATLLEVRLRALERQVLVHWSQFTIWNAGKQGRRVLALLAPEHRAKVRAFCDVDVRKLARGSYFRKGMPAPLPIVSYTAATPPLLLCVKLDLTGGAFEANLASLSLRPHVDYVYFC